ncbi:hypothetical protein EVA_18622, partial [gut metagenome]
MLNVALGEVTGKYGDINRGQYGIESLTGNVNGDNYSVNDLIVALK